MKFTDIFEHDLNKVLNHIWAVSKEARKPMDAIALRRAGMYLQKWEKGIPKKDMLLAKNIRYRLYRIMTKVINERQELEKETMNQHRR